MPAFSLAAIAGRAPAAGGKASMAGLPAAVQLKLAQDINKLAFQLRQGPALGPEQLVAKLTGQTDEAQSSVGQMLLLALTDPEAREELGVQLQNIPGGGDIGRQAAANLSGLASVYSNSPFDILVAMAQGISKPSSSLSAFFDGLFASPDGVETHRNAVLDVLDRSKGILDAVVKQSAPPTPIAGSEAESHPSGLVPSAQGKLVFVGSMGNVAAKQGAIDNFPNEEHSRLMASLFTDISAVEARPFAGRSRQASELLAVLSRRDAQKSSVLLIGSLGVGRTALIEHVAAAVKAGTYELNRRFLELDLPKLAGLYSQPSPAAGMDPPFEAFFNSVLPALSRDTVVVIRGAERLLAPGANRILDRLEKAMERDSQRFIFTLESDAALPKEHFLRKFSERINLDRPEPQEAMQMLLAHKARLEAASGVSILDAAIEELVGIARNILNRLHPQELVDNMVRAVFSRAQVAQRNAAQAAASDLYSQISLATAKYRRTGAAKDFNEVLDLAQKLDAEQARLASPAPGELSARMVQELLAKIYPEQANSILNNMDYKKRLLDGITKIGERVIGQDVAVKEVGATLRTIAAGMDNGKGPRGSFLLLGPTGVGKTELARALAEAYSGDENLLVRLDMSEYMEKHETSKLIGAPPGYAGYEEGGRLTEAVAKRPGSVVLFDEIEKAHPEVFNSLLQLLDDGRLTDGKGKTVDFTKTIVFMTSNLASKLISDMYAEGKSNEEIRAEVQRVLEEKFKPEFLNRINVVAVVTPLSRAHILNIGKLQIKKQVAGPLARQGSRLEYVDDQVLEYAADNGGFDPRYGARPMARTIGRLIKDPVTDNVLAHEGNIEVSVDMKDGKVAVTSRPKIEPGAVKKPLPRGKLGAWVKRVLDPGAEMSPEAIKASYETFANPPDQVRGGGQRNKQPQRASETLEP
ncbi:MAG: AAA family ATPase [Elusimicrobia bacterium]|nr:AAA family ATPase [Elusimicrobiota bacterium]